MKKLLLSVIAFALILTSCYKKDFKNLNTRIDSLAAQVQGVATLAAGITSIQSQITALQAAVASIGTNVSTLQTGLTSLTTTVNTLSTNLTALSTAVAAGNTTTQGLINSLSTLVANNQTAALAAINAVNTSLTTAISNAVTNINGTTAAAITAAQAALNTAITNAQTNINSTTAAAITAAQTALTTLINNSFANTDAAIANLSLQLTNAVTALNTSIAAAVTAITTDNATQTTVLTALINAMMTQLAIANAQLATLVNSNNIFVGNLVINDETTLTFAESLGAKVRAITGNLTIDASTFSASQMTRLKDVTNNTNTLPAPQQNPYIGTVIGNVTISGSQAVDLSKLVSVSGDGITTGSITVSGAAHDLSSLISVKKDYNVNVDVSDDALQTVNGNLTLDYPGAYSYPNLTTVGGVLTAVAKVGGVGNRTTSISFPSTASSVVFNDGPDNGVQPNGDLTYVWATSVNIGSSASLYRLIMNGVATSVTLGEDVYTGGSLTVWASFATLANLSVVSVNGPVQLLIGDLRTATTGATVVNLNSFTSSTGAVEIHTSGTPVAASPTGNAGDPGTINMPLYASNQPLELEGPTTQSLASYTRNIISSSTIRTLTLPVYKAQDDGGVAGGSLNQFVNLTALRTLTLGDLENDIDPLSFVNLTTLQNITLTADRYTVNVDLTGITSLLSASTAGLLESLTLSGNSSLTSVTTAGNMDFFTLNNCDAVGLTVNMGHSYVTSILGQGSTTIVTNNDNLLSLTTSTSRMKNLTVTGNTKLATANFSSFVAGDNITAGVVTIAVNNNNLVASYTQSVFVTNSAPVIAQSSLATLKAYAINILNSGAHAGSTVALGFSLTSLGGDATIATLDADQLAYTTAGGPANTSFVQRSTDPAGGVGTYIDVARELGYIQ